MSGVKISALPVTAPLLAADIFPVASGAVTKSATAQVIRQFVGEGLSNAATTGVSGAYAADTYLAGSAIVAPVGTWAVGTIVRWVFDMVKTGAGTATIGISVRMGTLGTTGDASVYSFTFGAGTANADTGIFDVTVAFRTVGSGTSAVMAGFARCTHHLAATGLTSTGAAGVGIILPGASAGFNSTTQTIIGLSFNGGASFSGSNSIVTADADKV